MGDASETQGLSPGGSTPVHYGASGGDTGPSTPVGQSSPAWEPITWELAASFQAPAPAKVGPEVYAALYDTSAADELEGTGVWRCAPAHGSAALAHIKQADDARAIQRRARYKRLAIGFVVVLAILAFIGTYLRPGTSWKALLTLGTIMMDLVFMWVEFPPDAVFLFSTAFLCLTGCVDSTGALAGFSNEGVMSIGALLALAKAAYESGAVGIVMSKVLGAPSSARGALLRMMPPVMFISAFLNNTPVVAILIPELRTWGQKYDVGVGKLLMPLSFASILGGSLTLIGSSINIIAASQAAKVPGGPESVPMFSLFPVGAAQALAGMLYLMAMEPLLPVGPKETGDVEAPGTPTAPKGEKRSYTVQFRVNQQSPFIGRSAASEGLTKVPGVIRVVRVEHKSAGLTAEGEGAADVVLQADSLLLIEALAVGVVGLRRKRGITLEPQKGILQHRQGDLSRWPRRRHRILVEVVCGSNCAWISGKPYEGAEPLAISGGKKKCERGDSVLVECFPQFATAYSVLSSHFLLILPVPDSKPPRSSGGADTVRMFIVLGIMITVMVLASLSVFPLLFVVLAALLALILTQSIQIAEAWAAVDGRMLVTIASAFGVSNAMQQSGAAELAAESLSHMADAFGGSQLATLLIVYLVVALTSSVVSSNAVVVLMMPVVFRAKAQSDPLSAALPYALLVIYAASANYATPFAYQTNLMVWRPGGYSFGDFLRVGAGLQVVCITIAVLGCWLLLGVYPAQQAL
eukprot:TRINITY_DN8173_c0_g3_i1.p1 TRINITY_DN8173_c0_g3~~TRINITY_DN8173_c0_g3_i1.p1  ORF type:complete len:777 (+),score=215.85 TRINITY_DN8173_c0_g3_i1:86-2332(+)